MDPSQRKNRLADEASLYLQQHAHQPVDWYPWGTEALDRARNENKPIFLSIGYSACHWCHVMAEESFADEAIARQMNSDFINIKVDREERPDVDALYMKSLVELTGQGGWPMSVFLTPDQEPYLAGTYFPPTTRGRQAGFPQILEQAKQLYGDQENQTRQRAQDILDRVDRTFAETPEGPSSAHDLMDQAVAVLSERYDETYGGFGVGMKFPEPMVYALLLRHWWGRSANDSVMMVDRSLTRMAEGGMYDQLGGGFHRYATDRQWRIPHFEKMLSDNALLARLFLQAYQATGQELYERIPREIFQYLQREMESTEGGFYASQAAQGGQGEGGFYLWEMKEVLNLLGPRHAQIFARAYGVTSTGNFQGKNVLHLKESMDKIAESGAAPIFEVDHILKTGRQTLLAARSQRPLPERDEKILAGWNGMTIGAFALAHFVLQDSAYLETAQRTAEFIWQNLRRDGILMRVYQNGEARVPGCLEDYAWLLDGMEMLFETSGDVLWLDRCQTLAQEMIDGFWDTETGGFFMTGTHQEGLRLRLKEVLDEAAPASNAVAAMALIKLGRWTGHAEFSEKGRDTLKALRGSMQASPAGSTALLAALDFLESPPIEVVLSGPEDDKEYRAMLEVIARNYRPNQLLVLYRGEETVARVPWAEGRGSIADRPTAYVCKAHTCRPPVHDAESLYNQLGRPPHINLNIFDEDKHVKDMQSREQDNFLNAMSDIFKYSGLGPRK